jgi:dihydrofolate reductase
MGNETIDKKTGPIVSIIAALGERTRAIGKGGSLLWRISGDLPRFKTLTTGHPIIMGQKTFESIGKVLPNRTNIVISHVKDHKISGATVVSSPEEALEKARELDTDEIFIIGGGQIYTQMLPKADRLYLTLVDSDEEGDTHFPPYPYFRTLLHEESSPESEPPHRFVILERA